MAGRFKFASKLGIYERLPGLTLAENLVSENGEVVHTKNTLMTREIVEELQRQRFFENGAHTIRLQINEELNTYFDKVNVVRVYTNEDKNRTINIVGTDLNVKEKIVTIPDIVATFSYFMNIQEGVGNLDEIDHLGNRRVRCVGELVQNQFRVGLSRIANQLKIVPPLLILKINRAKTG